jgi:parallel beta-helix repeat protein
MLKYKNKIIWFRGFFSSILIAVLISSAVIGGTIFISGNGVSYSGGSVGFFYNDEMNCLEWNGTSYFENINNVRFVSGFISDINNPVGSDIQRAIDDCSENEWKLIVVDNVPNEPYIVNESIKIPSYTILLVRENITVKADENKNNVSIFINKHFNMPYGEEGWAVDTHVYVIGQGGTLDGNWRNLKADDGTPGMYTYCVGFNNVEYGKILDLHAKNSVRSEIFLYGYNNHIEISGNIIDSSDGSTYSSPISLHWGLLTDGDVKKVCNVSITNNVCIGSGTISDQSRSIYLSGCENVIVEGNHCIDSNGEGIFLFTGDDTTRPGDTYSIGLKNIIVKNNIITNTFSYGMRVIMTWDPQNMEDVIISGNILNNTGDDAIFVSGIEVSPGGITRDDPITGLIIQENIRSESSDDGIHLNNVTWSIISDNIIKHSSSRAMWFENISNCSIHNNIALDSTNDDFFFDETNKNNIITSNKFDTDNIIIDFIEYNTFLDNIGLILYNNGKVTIGTGNNNIIVSHDCAVTPSIVLVTPAENITANGITNYWVDTINTTHFTLHVDGIVSADTDMFWRCMI